jgi:heme oxygenase
VLTRLSLAARARYPRADAVWLDLLGDEISASRYIAALVNVYGFEAPVEAALSYTPSLVELVNMRGLARSQLIIDDLMKLGIGPQEVSRVEQCAEVAPFVDTAEALGWLYVIKRSMLVHPRIMATLSRTLPMAADASSYLGHDDGQLGAQWSRVAALIEDFAGTSDRQDRVLRGAYDALDCQQRWSARAT